MAPWAPMCKIWEELDYHFKIKFYKLLQKKKIFLSKI